MSTYSRREEIATWLILVILIIQVGLLFVMSRKISSLEQYLAPPAPVVVDRIPDQRGYESGPRDAPVVVVEFADYQCPYCSSALEPVKNLLEKYPEQVRFVYRHFPLEGHPDAFSAAVAAECAGEQEKFWEMHEILFANQKALKAEDLHGYAKELGLDLAQFNTCIESGRVEAGIEQDRTDGLNYRVNGTPTFFVNRQMIAGLSGLEKAVSKAVSEAAR